MRENVHRIQIPGGKRHARFRTEITIAFTNT